MGAIAKRVFGARDRLAEIIEGDTGADQGDCETAAEDILKEFDFVTLLDEDE